MQNSEKVSNSKFSYLPALMLLLLRSPLASFQSYKCFIVRAGRNERERWQLHEMKFQIDTHLHNIHLVFAEADAVRIRRRNWKNFEQFPYIWRSITFQYNSYNPFKQPFHSFTYPKIIIVSSHLQHADADIWISTHLPSSFDIISIFNEKRWIRKFQLQTQYDDDVSRSNSPSWTPWLSRCWTSWEMCF